MHERTLNTKKHIKEHHKILDTVLSQLRFNSVLFIIDVVILLLYEMTSIGDHIDNVILRM